MFGFYKKYDLQKQIEILESLNITYDSSVNISDIFSEKEYHDNQFNLLLIAYGSENENTGKYISDDVYYFDTECIEDHGDYVRILENLKRISKNELSISDIHDYIDIDEEKAWVQFVFNGENIKIDLTVDDDWVDPKIFDEIDNLVDKLNTDKQFVTLSFGGQDLVFGYFSKDQISKLNKYNINFEK